MAQRFRALTQKPRYKRIIAVDTEDNTKGQMYYGVLQYGEKEFYDAESAEDMRELLYSLRWRGCLCVCVNLEYDLASIFGKKWAGLETTFSRGGLIVARLKLLDRNGSRSRTGKKRGDEYLEFIDLLNIDRSASVEKFGRLVGIRKKKEEVKDILGKPWADLSPIQRRTLKEYCQRDTEITWKAGVALQDTFNDLGGDMSCTVGKVAMTTFRRKYQKVSYDRLDPLDLEYLHDAYYGGRTEAFRIGKIKKKLYYADVNSMYPNAMKTLRFPDPDSMKRRLKMSRRLLKYDGITHALVHVPTSMRYPPLPVLTGSWPEKIEEGTLETDQEVNGFKLVFPSGVFLGCWTHTELRYALSLPGVKVLRYLDGCVFKKSDYYLRSFVEDIYKKRLAAKTMIERQCFKLIMNSLYGKFSQRGSKTTLIDVDDFDMLDDDEEGWEDQWSETTMWPPEDPRFVMRTSSIRPPIHTNIIWSAIITAAARVKLHQLLVKYQAIYCDTDSIITARKTPNSKELGELKTEKVLSEIEILAPKHYRYRGTGERKWETVCKGVPKRVHKEAFKRKDGTIRVTYQKPYKIREALRRGKTMNLWHDVTKVISARYDKRVILPGGDTRPIQVKEVYCEKDSA